MAPAEEALPVLAARSASSSPHPEAAPTTAEAQPSIPEATLPAVSPGYFLLDLRQAI